jgi:hypothetical protein
MNDTFEIPVSYKGNDLVFEARLLNYGYNYKIQVEINGIDVFLEPDEEKNFRVIVDPSHLEGKNKLNIELLEIIVSTIESVMK